MSRRFSASQPRPRRREPQHTPPRRARGRAAAYATSRVAYALLAAGALLSQPLTVVAQGVAADSTGVVSIGPGGGGTDADSTTASAPITTDMLRFLQLATTGLTDADVVNAACKSGATLQRFGKLFSALNQGQQAWSAVSKAIGGSGLPVNDIPAGIAAGAYAKAVSLGTTAEQYQATFAVGSLCNTSETARMTSAMYQFVRNVVNRGVEASLPALDSSFASVDAAQDPIGHATRQARYARLFGHVDARGQYLPTASAEVAVADSTAAEAYQFADQAEAAANASQATLRQLYAEAITPPQRDAAGNYVCVTMDSTGRTVSRWPEVAPGGRLSCGAASVGRSHQITSQVSILNGTQLSLLNQLEARRVDLEAIRVKMELQRELLDRATLLDRAVR